MDSNTHSNRRPASQSTDQPDGLAALAAVVEQLAAQDLTGLADAVRAERVLGLRGLLDRLEGHGLAELAAVDARGAAGADQGLKAPSTASWLRARLRLGAGAAPSSVRTARALCRGPLTHTGQALTDGAITPAHASVVASGTQELPPRLRSRPNRCGVPDGEPGCRVRRRAVEQQPGSRTRTEPSSCGGPAAPAAQRVPQPQQLPQPSGTAADQRLGQVLTGRASSARGRVQVRDGS
jgi:hypothetical protein